MRLVVDANIIMAAFIRDSAVRKLLFRPDNRFYFPEFILEEIEGHFDEIRERSGLSREDAKTVLELIFTRIEIIPAQKMAGHFESAESMMSGIGKKDVPYVALALGMPNDGIWRTAELVKLP